MNFDYRVFLATANFDIADAPLNSNSLTLGRNCVSYIWQMEKITAYCVETLSRAWMQFGEVY